MKTLKYVITRILPQGQMFLIIHKTKPHTMGACIPQISNLLCIGCKSSNKAH